MLTLDLRRIERKYQQMENEQMAYMTGITFFSNVAEARVNQPINHKNYVIEEHKDGTAAIVYLQDKPAQQGQVEYKG